MQVDVVNINNEKVETIELPDEVFAGEVNETLLWEQVKAQRASWRRGTHSTKTRGEVRGTGAKPFKQKGTGRARQGSNRSPNHVGGGIVWGPKPRDYSYRLPRSARKAALKSALSIRCTTGSLVVLDKFELEKPQTKSVIGFMKRMNMTNALLVDSSNDNLKLSARNLQRFGYIEGHAINVYDVLNHDKLVMTKVAVEAVVAKVNSEKKRETSN